MPATDVEYAGFWLRVWAAIIDSFLVLLVVGPILTMIYGRDYWVSTSLVRGPLDFLFSWVMPAVAVVLFWMNAQATPGKMAIAARIVDAETGGMPSTRQLIIRYLGYILATIPLGLGLLWVAFDPRKQGWHDKMAGTVVVRKKAGTTKPVTFAGEHNR